jgi:hypothetical protein
MSGSIIYHGLRYTDVDIVIRRYGYKGKKADEIFKDVQIMEYAALPELNAKK